MKEVEREKLNAILNEFNLDDGNFRSWFAKEPDFIKKDNKIQIRLIGIEKSRTILEEAVNQELASGWIPGAESKKTRQKKSTSKNVESQTGKPTKINKAKSKSESTTSERPTATKMLNRLIADNFFNTPREINDIITHCKNNLGYSYTTQHFTMPLVRLVRQDKLDRDINQKNKYEYKTKIAST